MEKKSISSFIIILTLLGFALAQQDQIYNIISQLAAVIFIIVFILILLAIGGVLRFPRGGISLGVIGFIVLIILLFIIPQFVPFPAYLEVPENFKIYPLPSYAASVFEMLGLPREWMYVPAIIYLFILPFAAIYTLAWAFLQSLTMFTNVPSSVNRILAFIIAFLTIPIGWFVKIVWILFSFMGVWSVVVFAATFIVGVFFRGVGIAAKEHAEFKKYTYNIRTRMHQMIDELNDIKKISLPQERQKRLNTFLARFEADLRTFDAWDKAYNAMSDPTDQNINEVINQLKSYARK